MEENMGESKRTPSTTDRVSPAFGCPPSLCNSIQTANVGLKRLDDKHIRLLSSTISAFTATTVVHPLDVIRISQQTNITAQYTISYLYRGYAAGLLRQMTYSVPNVTIFTELIQRHKREHGSEPNFTNKALFGAISGAISGVTGTPSEVVLVRAINPKIPSVSIITGAHKIYTDHGISGFLKGAYVASFRSSVFNSIRLSVYAECKTRVQSAHPRLEGTSTLHFIAAILGTGTGVLVSNPIDVIKSKLQANQSKILVKDIISTTYAQGGPLGFYKGVVASLFKSIPHSIITFVILEKLTRIITGNDAI